MTDATTAPRKTRPPRILRSYCLPVHLASLLDVAAGISGQSRTAILEAALKRELAPMLAEVLS